MQDTAPQGSPDPVVELVRRESLKVVRKSFLIYLATAVLVVVVVGGLGLLFGGSGYPWTGFEEIFGFIVAVSAGIVYSQAKLKSPRGLGTCFYILGVLGLGLGGFFFSWGGYSLLSAGYWERQASKTQGCKCSRDREDLVVVGGETLACPKCSRRIRIGFDVPRLWNRLGLAALVAGIALLVLYGLMPGISEALLLSYLGYLLLFDGIIVGFSPLAFHEYLSGYVRIPPDQSGSANPRK